MPSYAAFLRGINVGGRQATKEQLCSCFEGLGYEDVSTFRASGNVLFSAGRRSLETLSAEIEEALELSLGYQVTTFLRGADEVRRIAGHEPFDPAEAAASRGKLQVMLLADEPTPEATRAVLAMATGEDRLAFGGRELYWLPSGNIRDSALKLKRVEALVGTWTMRTKGTIEQIARKHFADRSSR